VSAASWVPLRKTPRLNIGLDDDQAAIAVAWG
jgi:hypothetical protein